VRRREFIKLAHRRGVAVPSATHAETRPHRVGVLVIGRPDPEPFWRVFRDAMQTRVILRQECRLRIPVSRRGCHATSALAAGLVRLNVDVIVTWYTPTVRAAKDATADIPIIMADAGDPVGTGLVDSLARPGANITGIAGITAELAAKTVDLYREMLPSVRRLAALCNVADPFSKPFFRQIEMRRARPGLSCSLCLSGPALKRRKPSPGVGQSMPSSFSPAC